MIAIHPSSDILPHPVKFTVLGGGGFIGRRVAARLHALGHQCWTPGRSEPLVLTEDLGHVIYAIGLTADFRIRPYETVDAHIGFLRLLLDKGIFRSLTYLSSSRVYTGAEVTHEDAVLHVNPSSASDFYNLSKLMGEALCMHGGRRATTIARLSNVVGPGMRDCFLAQIIEEGFRTNHVHFHTSMSSAKDYVWVDDVCDALIDLGLGSYSGIVNIASGQNVTNQHIANLLENYCKWTTSVAINAEERLSKPIDHAAAYRVLNFRPRSFDNYFPALLQQASP